MNMQPAAGHKQLPSLDLLHQQAQQIRCDLLQMITRARASHLACGLCVVDLLNVLYTNYLDLDAIKNNRYPRDFFVLSKGHAAAALYATHAAVGLMPRERLQEFYLDGSLLAGHPIRHASPGIEASTGSLGHGLSLAVGFARALRDDGHHQRAFALLGDGECQEGSVWEAVDMAVSMKLGNLVVLIDDNGFQGLGETHTVVPTPLEQKFAAFGCATTVVDGNDYQQLITALDNTIHAVLPTAIVAKTVKGRGVSFIEGSPLMWHYTTPSAQQLTDACTEVNET